MVPNEEAAGGGAATTEVWKGDLRDKREIAVRESGLVVTHRLTSTTRSPVEFQIVDPLPGRIDADEVGFHPEHEPPHGRIDADQAVLSGVVSPDTELVVKYGLRLDPPRAVDAIEDLQASVSPSIELSRPVDPGSTRAADLETAAMTRSAAAADPADGESVPFFDWLRRSIQSDQGGNGPDPEEADADEGGQPAESATGPTAEEQRATGAAADRDDDAATPSSEAGAEPGNEGERSSPWNDHAGEESIAAALLHELESGALSAEQRRRLATAVLEVLDPAETPRKSTDIRLRAVESKLQQFEAYADVLAAIIDEHGPAEEFLADVRGDIDSLERDVGALQGDLERSVAAREALDDRLDAVADDVAVATSRLERVEDRLESLRADHRSEVSALEGAVDELEPAAEEVDQLSSVVASLRNDLDDVRARHRAIARALTGAGDRQE